MDDQRRYDPVQDRWYVDVYQVKRGDAWHDETMQHFLSHPIGQQWRVRRVYEGNPAMTFSATADFVE